MNIPKIIGKKSKGGDLFYKTQYTRKRKKPAGCAYGTDPCGLENTKNDNYYLQILFKTGFALC